MNQLLIDSLEMEIFRWHDRRPKTYFYKYYLGKKSYKREEERKYKEKHRLFRFNCMLEDGFTNEQIVKLFYKSRLEKKRLSKKLIELNIEPYMVNSIIHFPILNKNGNFSEVYYNNVEILF